MQTYTTWFIVVKSMKRRNYINYDLNNHWGDKDLSTELVADVVQLKNNFVKKN